MMPVQQVKKAVVMAGIAGIMIVAAVVSGAAPSAGEQVKGDVSKKAVRKGFPIQQDSVAAVVPVLEPDPSKSDTASTAPLLYSFVIVTEPDSVSVLLDDSLRGFSPCTLSGVSSGGHMVILKKNGYYLKRAEIAVDSATPPELSFVLLKPAFLRVTTDPAGARLFLDGKEEGSTPYESDRVKPGDHAVRVELRQYATAEQPVAVKNGGRDTVHFSLEHSKAYRDSVETARLAGEKLKKDRFTFSVVSAIFCMAAILLIIIEANND
jgi:hypothetical protein